jgi:uncharacterized protein YndB with AHSA1/START domain
MEPVGADLDPADLEASGVDAVGVDAVERAVELEASVGEVWDAVCDPTGWLADSGWLDVRPGGEGRLTDDGVDRDVVVDTVDEHRRLVYRWWRPEDGPEGASRVEITVLPTDGVTRLVIRESRPRVAGSALRWEVRAACLSLRATGSAPFSASLSPSSRSALSLSGV